MLEYCNVVFAFTCLENNHTILDNIVILSQNMNIIFDNDY